MEPIGSSANSSRGMKKELRTRTVAIYGQIGSGKTEVARTFEQLGAHVISADAIGHEVLSEDKLVRKSLVAEFGSEILNESGRIDRKTLASLAFQTEAQREALDAIVHPQLLARLRKSIKASVELGKYEIVAVDAALIVRWQMQEEFDFLVCVTASTKTRIERLVNAGYSQDDAENRIATQIPSDIQADTADFIIQNRGSLEALRERAAEVFRSIIEADFLN